MGHHRLHRRVVLTSLVVIGGDQDPWRVVDEMVLKAPQIKVAFGENPKRCFEQKNIKTRMAVAAILRPLAAQDYLAKKQRATEDQVLDRDLGLEVIGQVLRREIPLRAHAHRADDIMTAIRIAEEFNVDLVLEHCTEGHKISDILAQRGYPAIVGPTHSSRSKYELKDTAPANPTILAKAGVLVALMTDHPVIPINHLILTASLAVKAGMDREEALRAVTINPAQILGVEKRVGSIEVGKDADLVLWSQDPLDVQAKVARVLINGKVVYQQ